MLLYDSERSKNNEAIREFIVKLTMITMVKLRNNDNLSDSILPIPKTLGEISRTDEMIESVVRNIVKNELKLYSITDDKELYFKAGSPFSEIDVMSVIDRSRDNTDTTDILGEKLIYTANFVRNTVLNVIKELINNVKAAKIAYEGNRKASSMSLIPLISPDIIEYFILKGELKDSAEPAVIPSPSDNILDNKLEMINSEETNELSLISAMFEYYSFSEEFLKTFLSEFQEGEVIKIAKTYLGEITSENQNLNMLAIKDLSKTNTLYLVYLIAKMLHSKYYAENEVLERLLKTLSRLVYTRFTDIKDDAKKDILVSWIENRRIYINAAVFNSIEIDVMAIVGAVISENVSNGGLAITGAEVVTNSDMFIEAYNKFEAANTLEIQLGMKNTIINIFTNEITKVYEKYKATDEEALSALQISGKCFEYLQTKEFKDVIDIEKAAQDVILNLVYTDEASRLFVDYFTAYSGMESSLTPQDCALLAGTTLVALEIGAYLDVK